MKKFINKDRLTFYKDEGQTIPRFYLPVRWIIMNGQLECWVFYLAPFVWFGYAIYNAFYSIIKDATEWGKLLEQKRKGFTTKF